MRVLLVSDLHYSLPQLDWVVDASSSYDVVAVVGDSLNISSAVPLDAQSIVVSRYLEEIASRTQLVVSSGNHDLTGPDEHGEQTALWLSEARRVGIPIDGDSVVVEDTLLTICPWWDGPNGRSEVASQLRADAERRPARWVWLYHWPPLGSPTCWTGRRDYGDSDVRGWINQFQPDVVFCGHVHESPFKIDGSWVDRIGRDLGVQRRSPDREGARIHRARLRSEPCPMGIHHGLGDIGPAAIPCRRPALCSDSESCWSSIALRRAAGY